MARDLREQSRQTWHPNSAVPDAKEIQIGCLQRVADATELMAKNYATLIEDRNWYKRMAEDRYKEILKLRKSNSALRGVITKQKKTSGGNTVEEKVLQ